MESVNVGIIGLGTVGASVLKAIKDNNLLIAERSGVELIVKGVCDKDKKALDKADVPEGAIKTDSYEDLINDKDIDIIVELVGGVHPTKDIILDAVNKKKHVVTANKALLSEHWKEIFEAATKCGVYVDFEASVGGAIPIIRTLRESFVGNKISTIYGILNGTTNFILTMMAEKGCSFDEALALAQEAGVAEADPELDISGADSAHKLALVSMLSFGLAVYPKDIYTEGISSLGPQDIMYADRWGYSIKLLAIAKDTPQGIQVRVHPTLFRSTHLLSDVSGVDNAILIKGDLIGESLLFGKGAGGVPTSSSVVGDIVEIAKHVAFSSEKEPSPYNLHYSSSDRTISPLEDLVISYYFRFSVLDKPGVLAGISSILSEHEISIASVTQEEHNEGEMVPLIIQTHKCREGDMRKAIDKIDKNDYVMDKTVVIRIEE